MIKFFPFLFFLLVLGCSEKQATSGELATKNSERHKKDLIKSVHYFSSAWPITFWQDFEEGDVARELQQIKNDGFNTVILVVPWRGFEVGFENEQTASIPFFYDRLSFVLAEITKQELKYILRLGFPHFHMPEEKTYALEQCIGIYTDKKTQSQWRDYLQKIKEATAPFHPYYAGTLVSWEDFWCPHSYFPIQPFESRLQMAQFMNYGKWLQQQNQNMVKVFLQQNNVNFDQVAVPEPADLSYVLYLDFIDKMFKELLLQPTQDTFTDAAMEIRVDKLPVKQGDNYTWIDHDLYLEEKNLRGTYWAPFWGAANNGELISAKQALDTFHYFLKMVSDNGKNTNHVLEQFNFYDNTIHYPNHANIKPDEIETFLIGAQPLIEKYSKGFGVWAYRDYHDNAILNGSFEMGTTGWYISGNGKIISDNQDESLFLEANSSLVQKFLPDKRFKLLIEYDHVTMCLISSNNTHLEVNLGDQPIKKWPIEKGGNCTQLSADPFKVLDPINFSITTTSDVTIDEIKLYGFTQILGLYDANGKPSKYIDIYRQINSL